ncbi:hypothetical protein A6770_30420 [Nostoc minutum NIES-26]|uniref:Beta/gamma crystallin 'Greek key' domain-containing protein n=1 Tax=Nostoc minutum NIES-26 TaxID=1844469 RepID=A0A367QBK6_9NOSO|nr:hypothetical protein A6770_30420 [Nostoc minutum NIES-26]
MSNINNHGVDMNNKQIKDLYSIEAVQDLSHKAAATISGGALFLMNDSSGVGTRKLKKAERSLGPLNNKASEYVVTGNRDWIVYTGKNFTGDSRRLQVGARGRFTGRFNNNIASARPA